MLNLFSPRNLFIFLNRISKLIKIILLPLLVVSLIFALINSGGAALLVTEKNGAATVGTVTLAGGAVEYINKVPAHTLEGGAALKVVHVGFAN